MIKSHTLVFSDFESDWYKRNATLLKQDSKHLDNHSLNANKFWQNAIIAEVVFNKFKDNKNIIGIGFGVGQERLPSLFASKGYRILATDQDFKTDKAKYWSKYELAQGPNSLNRLKICPPATFKKNVNYMAIDMKKIPKKLTDSYNFLWSNCALGHLGSIEAGLEYIEESLKCLKPGGLAVHTTELNVLSDKYTSTSGDTVIFRPRDIKKLFRKLANQGYICETLKYTLGDSAMDSRVSMRPQFGNDYSKIQVNGHLATQGLIIIHKPLQLNVSFAFRLKQNAKHQKAYLQNLNAIRTFRNRPSIKQILRSQKFTPSSLHFKAKSKVINVKIEQGKTKEVFIPYFNKSHIPVFGLYSRLGKSKPIVLATSNPKDRRSEFVDRSWAGSDANRPGYDLREEKNGEYAILDFVLPKQEFGFLITMNSNKLPKGNYIEEMSIVQELAGWVEGSEVTLKITVV